MRKNRSNCTRGIELHNLAKSPWRGTGGARVPTPPQKCRLAMLCHHKKGDGTDVFDRQTQRIVAAWLY